MLSRNAALVTSVLQQYMTPVLPSGCIVRFRLLSTHGDPHYIGLNGIELFGGDGRRIDVHAGQIQASPRDVNELKTVREERESESSSEEEEADWDPRTPDKLIDGVNDTLIDSHMWLAPYTPGLANQVFVVFDTPVTLSMIKVSSRGGKGRKG